MREVRVLVNDSKHVTAQEITEDNEQMFVDNMFEGIVECTLIFSDPEKARLIEALKTRDFPVIRDLYKASRELQEDQEIMLAAVQHDVCALDYASQELLRNRDFMLEAVTHDGYALRWAARELRNDPELVLKAIERDVSALKYASKELRGRHDFMLAAVRHDWGALQYTSEETGDDHVLALEAVQQSWEAFKFVSQELRGDYDIQLAAVKQSWRALEYVPPDLMSFKILFEGVKQSWSALHYAKGKLSNGELLQEAGRGLLHGALSLSSEYVEREECVLEQVWENQEVLALQAPKDFEANVLTDVTNGLRKDPDDAGEQYEVSQIEKGANENLWPAFHEDQQRDFQNWAQARRLQQTMVLDTQLHEALDQVERAQAEGDVEAANSSLRLVRKLRSALEDLDSTEYSRNEAWKFFFEL